MTTALKQETLAGRGLVWRCSDCRAWADDACDVRHSKRCDFNPTTTDAPANTHINRAALADGLVVTACGSEDAVVSAVRRGLITQNQAMNRDD